MSFEERLDEHFPNAADERSYVEATYNSLQSFGFDSDNAIACVGVCRDELTQSFVAQVRRKWGEAFNFSGLGGMLFLGRTGFAAAHSHAPVVNGRERYIYYVMPHIAISDLGEIGVCSRNGRVAPSAACGALMAFLNELESGAVSLTLQGDDMEQSQLKRRLHPALSRTESPDLVSLTKTAARVILEDLQEMIAKTVDVGIADYAVFNAIQIHGPNNAQYVHALKSYAIVRNAKYEIEL